MKQSVALTGRNSTGPPWSVTDDDRRRQMTTDAREHHLSGPFTLYLGVLVINVICKSKILAVDVV